MHHCLLLVFLLSFLGYAFLSFHFLFFPPISFLLSCLSILNSSHKFPNMVLSFVTSFCTVLFYSCPTYYTFFHICYLTFLPLSASPHCSFALSSFTPSYFSFFHALFLSFLPFFHCCVVNTFLHYFFFSCILMFFFVILSCCYCLSFLLHWPYFFFSIFVSLFDFLFLTSLIFFVLFVLYAIIAFSSLPFLCPSCSPPTSFPLTLITFPLQYLIF